MLLACSCAAFVCAVGGARSGWLFWEAAAAVDSAAAASQPTSQPLLPLPLNATQVTELFSGYVGAMLAEYAAAPATAWKAKDCAVYLVTALAVRGKTAAAGACCCCAAPGLLLQQCPRRARSASCAP